MAVAHDPDCGSGWPGARVGVTPSAPAPGPVALGLREGGRGLRWAQRVETEDPLDLGRHGHRDLGCRAVVVPGLPRREPVAVDRCGEGGLHLRHGPRDRERQAGARRGPHRKTRLPQGGGDLCHGARRRSEALCELLRGEEVVIVGRGRVGHGLGLGRQCGRVARLQRHGEGQDRRRRSRTEEGGTGWHLRLTSVQRFESRPRTEGGGVGSGRRGRATPSPPGPWAQRVRTQVATRRTPPPRRYNSIPLSDTAPLAATNYSPAEARIDQLDDLASPGGPEKGPAQSEGRGPVPSHQRIRASRRSLTLPLPANQRAESSSARTAGRGS